MLRTNTVLPFPKSVPVRWERETFQALSLPGRFLLGRRIGSEEGGPLSASWPLWCASVCFFHEALLCIGEVRFLEENKEEKVTVSNYCVRGTSTVVRFS